MLETLEVTSFCNNNNISIEELLLLYRIMTLKNSLNKDEKLRIELEKYNRRNKTVFDYKKLVDLLVDKELVINNNDKSEYQVSKLVITDKFLNTICIDKDICFKEIVEIYPNFIQIGSNEVPSMTFKGGTSLLKEKYFNDILKGGNKFLHERFKRITSEFFIDKRYAQNKLSDYIENFEIFAIMEETKKAKIHDKNRR